MISIFIWLSLRFSIVSLLQFWRINLCVAFFSYAKVEIPWRFLKLNMTFLDSSKKFLVIVLSKTFSYLLSVFYHCRHSSSYMLYLFIISYIFHNLLKFVPFFLSLGYVLNNFFVSVFQPLILSLVMTNQFEILWLNYIDS